MATRTEVDEYQSVIHGLSTVAFAQVKALLLSLDDPNPIRFRDALLATYPDLMAPFMASAGEVAAEWYSDLRLQANLTRTFIPVPAPLPPDAQLNAAVRYSLKPLFAPAPATSSSFIGSEILSLLAGFTQKFIANMGRDTIEGNSYADPVQTGWARIPQPGCCAFCAMLASRGPVYSSAEAAGSVIGRGIDESETAGRAGGQGKGVKVRGAGDLGSAYHKFCRCVATPVFPGGDNSFVFETQQHFTDQYSEIDGLVENSDGYLVTDLQATLSSWRHTHGTN